MSDVSRELPESYRSARLGIASRYGRIDVPVYSLRLILDHVGIEALEDLMRKPEETCPLILQMPAAGQFWERVRQRQFMAWAFMNPAIMGVVGWGIRIPHAILYDTEKLLTSLYNSQSTSTQSDKAQRWDDAKRFFAQRMLPFDCGESTPWYFTQL